MGQPGGPPQPGREDRGRARRRTRRAHQRPGHTAPHQGLVPARDRRVQLLPGQLGRGHAPGAGRERAPLRADARLLVHRAQHARAGARRPRERRRQPRRSLARAARLDRAAVRGAARDPHLRARAPPRRLRGRTRRRRRRPGPDRVLLGRLHPHHLALERRVASGGRREPGRARPARPRGGGTGERPGRAADRARAPRGRPRRPRGGGRAGLGRGGVRARHGRGQAGAVGGGRATPGSRSTAPTRPPTRAGAGRRRSPRRAIATARPRPRPTPSNRLARSAASGSAPSSSR